MRVDRPTRQQALLAGLRPPADTVGPVRRPPAARRSPPPRATTPDPPPAARRPPRRRHQGGDPPADRRADRIDPRIAARRDAVRHDEGRRRVRRIALVAGSVAVVAAAAGATRTPLLDIDAIEVVGATRTSAAVALTTVAEAGVVRGATMTDLELDPAEDVLVDLPWVLDASVQREWPGTVRIELRERTAVASVATPTAVVLVAADGTVLDTVDAPAPGVVALAEVPDPPAPGGAVDDTTQALLAVAAAVPATLRPTVASVAPGAGGGVDLVLAAGADFPAGVRVALGAAADPAAAFVAVVTVLEQVDLTCLASIDVRVPSAPVLTRGPACP